MDEQKKQEIEAMAKALGEKNFLCSGDCNDCVQIPCECRLWKHATILREAGYRKASDVERETAKDWIKFTKELIDNHNMSDRDYDDAVAQLKLKAEEYGVEVEE